VNVQLAGLKNLNNGQIVAADLLPATALCQWLYGFSDDPTAPLTGGARSKLFDFDQARITNATHASSVPSIPAGQYYPSGKLGSPYIYIDSASYTTPPTTGGATVRFWPFTGATTGAPGFTSGYFAQRMPSAIGWGDISQPALNPDTFQILCAGVDEQFGTDDDLSNCWPGTRKQYLDSLKQ
jgi:hypothetical protein